MNIMGLDMLLSRPWIGFALVGLMSATVFCICNKPRLVVIDMTRVIQIPAAKLAHSTLSAKAQGQFMTRFTKRLPAVIQDYSTSHNVTIINAQVLAQHNNIDITTEIIKETYLRLKNEN